MALPTPSTQDAIDKEQAIIRLREASPHLNQVALDVLRREIGEMTGAFASMRRLPTQIAEIVAHFIAANEGRLSPDEFRAPLRLWIQRGLESPGAYDLVSTLFRAGMEIAPELADRFELYRRQFTLAYEWVRRQDVLAEHEQMQRGMFTVLEKQVASEHEARTALERRQTQLQVANELARTSSATRELVPLMGGTMRQLQQGFGLDFAGIYLLDESQQWAILRAGAGDAGATLLQRGSQVRLDASSFFTRARALNQPLLFVDGKYQHEYLMQSISPETRLIIVAPLTARGEGIGFLTLHSQNAEAFSEHDLSVISLISDNLAHAIENAELFEKATGSLAELERVQRSYAHENWTKQEVLSQVIYSQKEDAFETELETNGESKNPLSVPVLLRGEVIGTVDLFDVTQPRVWSDNEKALATSVVEQMAMAVENARLFEESELAAQRLATLNRIARASTMPIGFDELARVIYHEINTLIKPDAFLMALYSASDQTMDFRLRVDHDVFYPAERLPSATTISGQVVAGGKPVLIDDLTKTENPDAGISFGSEESIRSWYGVPLRSGNDVIGVLAIQSYTPDAFSENEANLLETIGDQIGVAVERARLFDEAEKRAREMSVINDMARVLSGELKSAELYKTVYDFLPQLVHAEAFAVWLYDDAEHTITRPALYDRDEFFADEEGPRAPVGSVAHVIETREPVVINLSRAEWESKRSHIEETIGTHDPSASLLFVPLRVGAQVRGVMSVQTYVFDAYSPHQVSLMINVANHLASALENAKLFEGTQNALAETQFLYDMGSRLNQVTTLEDLVHTAAQPAFQQGAGSAQLLLLDYQDQPLPVAANVVVSLIASGELAPLNQYTHFPLEQFPFGRMLLENPSQPVLIENVGSTSILDEATRQVLLASDDHAIIMMPMGVEQRVLGAILIGWGETHTFGAREERIYRALAGQLAIVLNNRLLFEQTQAALAESQTLYEISARLNASSTIQEVLEAAAGPAIVEGANSASLLRLFLDTDGQPDELELVAIWPRNSEEPNPVGTRFPVSFATGAQRWLANPSEPVMDTRLALDLGASGHAFFAGESENAAAVLPLKLGNRWIGILMFHWARPRAFAPRDVRLYRAIMAQTAIVLDNRDLFEQTQVALQQTQSALVQVEQAQTRLNLQYQTARVLAEETWFHEAMPRLLELVCKSLRWQMGEYWALEEHMNKLRLAHIWTEDTPALRGFHGTTRSLVFGRGEGLAGKTWAENRPLWIPDIQHDSSFKQEGKAQAAGLTSAFSFPLIGEKGLYGVSLFFSNHPQTMDEPMIATMVGVGNQITQFIERRRAEESVRQQNTYLTALHDTTLGLMSRLDVSEVLQNIITAAADLVGTEHGYVHLVDPAGNELQMRVGIGVYQDLIGTRVKMGQGLAGKVWADGAPIVVSDYQMWSGRLPNVDRDILHAVVGVPLKSGDQTVGVLGLASLEQGRVFAPAQVEAVNRFAELAAIALDNAQLYDSTQRLLQKTQKVAEREKMTAEIADRLYSASDVHTVLRTAAEELRRSTGSKRAVVRVNLGGNGDVKNADAKSNEIA